MNNGSGKLYWRVRLGKRFTGGVVEQKYFLELASARIWIDQQKEQRQETGKAVFTPDQMAEVHGALKRLAGTGLSLTAAVTSALARHRRREDSIDWATALDKWLQAPRGRPLGTATAQAYTNSLRMLEEEMRREKLLPHEVTKMEVQSFLLNDENEWEPATIGHHLRNLACFFGFLKKEKLISENPCLGIPHPEVLGEVRILSPEAARALLAHALGPMRVCIGLGLFAGLRTSEIRRLDWSEIGETEIEIKASKTKTRRNRMVPILPSLGSILESFVGSRAGSVAPENWRQEFENVTAIAGYRNEQGDSVWPSNSMRHSFGSYRVAQVRNESQVVGEMGNSVEMLHRNYRRVVSSKNVEDFWSIRFREGKLIENLFDSIPKPVDTRRT